MWVDGPGYPGYPPGHSGPSAYMRMREAKLVWRLTPRIRVRRANRLVLMQKSLRLKSIRKTYILVRSLRHTSLRLKDCGETTIPNTRFGSGQPRSGRTGSGRTGSDSRLQKVRGQACAYASVQEVRVRKSKSEQKEAEVSKNKQN